MRRRTVAQLNAKREALIDSAKSAEVMQSGAIVLISEVLIEILGELRILNEGDDAPAAKTERYGE